MRLKQLLCTAVMVAFWCTSTITLAQTQVTFTSPTLLATLEGPYGTSQMSIGMYATDLGYSTSFNGELRVLFGDAVSDGYTTPIAIPNGWPFGFQADDTQGKISLSQSGGFPTGDSVEQWAAQAGHAKTPAWRSTGPTLDMRLNGTKVAPIQVWDGGANGTALYMGPGRTPIGAFSNNASSGGGVFAFFARQVATLCTTSASCGTGYVCDVNMGTCFGDNSENAVPCSRVPATNRCPCWMPLPSFGVCQDQTSSMYAPTEDGRVLSTVLRNRIGNADQSHNWEEVYYSKEFRTNKFNNLSVRTVSDFSPSRAVTSSANHFWPADGTGAHEAVFMWGRPNYLGYGTATHRSAKLYLAYSAMPSYGSTGPVGFTPKYFSGFSNTSGCTTGGASGSYPCFSSDPSKAWPLDLSYGTTACTQTGTTDRCTEQLDIVNQHTISWVPGMNRFVMLYGGDVPPSFMEYLAGPNYGSLVRNPDGAMYFRYAQYPWGPWSQPVPILKAGPRNPPTAGLQYAVNGTLYDPYCTPPGSNCVAADPGAIFSSEDQAVGRLYGPNIVDEWTMTRSSTVSDIYWFLSTWDPYEVVIAKTHLTLQ